MKLSADVNPVVWGLGINLQVVGERDLWVFYVSIGPCHITFYPWKRRS